jgi:hypothetical protein
MIAVGLAVGVVFATAGATGAGGSQKLPTQAQMAAARKSLLVLSDMPKGWKSSKSSGGNSPIPGAAQLARCLGVPLSVVKVDTPSVNSPEFDSHDHLETVDDSISLFPSAKAAMADFESGANPKAPGCLAADFNGPARAGLAKSFGAGATVGHIAVTRSPASDFASHSTNYTLFFPVTIGEVTLNIETTGVAFVKGSEEQDVTFISVQNPFSIPLARRLTKIADGRL